MDIMDFLIIFLIICDAGAFIINYIDDYDRIELKEK